MGANQFMVGAVGTTADEAFWAAVAEAKYESGHGGYTGTIAEKSSYVVIAVPAGKKPVEFAHALLEEDDARISNKWGPAGCVQIKPNHWCFFGWASS